jgi:hypothetical protein
MLPRYSVNTRTARKIKTLQKRLHPLSANKHNPNATCCEKSAIEICGRFLAQSMKFQMKGISSAVAECWVQTNDLSALSPTLSNPRGINNSEAVLGAIPHSCIFLMCLCTSNNHCIELYGSQLLSHGLVF